MRWEDGDVEGVILYIHGQSCLRQVEQLPTHTDRPMMPMQTMDAIFKISLSVRARRLQ